MKSLIIFPLVVLLSSSAFSQNNFWQRNQDKVAHIGVGYIVGATTYHFLYKGTKNKWKSRVGSVVISAFLGGLKEQFDKNPKGSDIFYTISGSILHFSITF